MHWKEASLMSLRSEFVSLARRPGANLALLARRFGVSRKTAYKWLRRWREGGPDGLADRPRRPHASPARTPDALERLVLDLRDDNPAWGGRKLRTRLRALGRAGVPAASTITAILRRHGRHDGPRAGRPRDCQRFEHPAPNDLWQMDFKGHSGVTGGGRCHPLTVLDDHSRYALALRACPDEATAPVREALAESFRCYGLPRRMLMDNGAPWGSDPEHPYTPLTVWLLRLGVGVSHGRPRHPQTQGKDQHFHRTLDAEVLLRRTFAGLGDSQGRFDAWRRVCNPERPHEALHLDVPASRYRPSPRGLPAEPPPIEYPAADAVRKVQEGGWFSFRGRDYRAPQALRGLPIALRATAEDGLLGLRFCRHRLGSLDLRRGVLQYGRGADEGRPPRIRGPTPGIISPAAGLYRGRGRRRAK
jgi:transposase InsO family protein